MRPNGSPRVSPHASRTVTSRPTLTRPRPRRLARPRRRGQVGAVRGGPRSGIVPRRVPYNMGTRYYQPERRVCGGSWYVAAAAERPTVTVTNMMAPGQIPRVGGGEHGL